jgi:hypothetical protein
MSTEEDILSGKQNPFVTLEALQECASSIRYSLRQCGCAIPVNDDGTYPPVTPGYYIEAVLEKSERLFQMLAIMLPESRAWSDGNGFPHPETIERANRLRGAWKKRK